MQLDAMNVLKEVMNICEDFIWIKDSLLQYVEVSQSFIELCGEERENLIGRRCSFMSNILSDSYKESDQIILAGERSYEDKIIFLNNDKIMKMHIKKVPYLDEAGKVIGIIGCATDVSEYAHERQALELVLDDLPYGVIIANKENIICKTNKRINDYFDVQENVIGKQITDIGIKENQLTDANYIVEEYSRFIGEREYTFKLQRFCLHDENGTKNSEILIISDY